MSGTSNPGLPFNPYKAWLGIDVSGRKPTHYELLGLEFGVVDAGVAKASVLERSAKIRHYQAGKHADLAAQLLDELAEAQLVLTNAEKKKNYDLSISKANPPTDSGKQKELTFKNGQKNQSPNDAPEMIVKAHSVKMNLDTATGYGLKAPEARDSRVEFISSLAKPQPKAGKRHWYLYGVAFSTAALISIVIGTVAWMAIERTHLESPKERIAFSNNEKLPQVDIPESESGKSKPINFAGESDLGSPMQATVAQAEVKAMENANESSNIQPLQQDNSISAPHFTNSIGIQLVRIPSGKFLMGSPDTEQGHEKMESPVHEVIISRDFFIGIYEITQENYQKVMGKNPSFFQEEKIKGNSSRHPVEQVSWDDAVEFCKRLSNMPEEKRFGRAYRLPTEGEWEYACRAGNNEPYSFGSNDSKSGEFGWFDNNSEQKTHPVGLKKPNGLGLYDMHGNVFEWCSDWLDGYNSGLFVDPAGPVSGQSKIFRGGGWNYGPPIGRSARRVWANPIEPSSARGFRVALSIPQGLAEKTNNHPPTQSTMNRDWLADHNPVSWNAFFPKEKMEGANSKSFMLHPFDSPALAVAIFENKNGTAFSSKVRLDSDPNSPVRFAVRASGKILWQSKDLFKRGDMDECWVDIKNHSKIELLTRCKNEKTFATAIWHYPHFIKTDEYDKKIKETEKFLDFSTVTDYWRDIGIPTVKSMESSQRAPQSIKFVEALQLMVKEVPQRNTKVKVSTVTSTSDKNKEATAVLNQNGWKAQGTYGYLFSEQVFGGPHDIKDKDMIYLTSRVDPKTNSTQYFLSNSVNTQTGQIVVFLGWVFTRQIPGTVPVVIRRFPGAGNSFTHSLFKGADPREVRKSVQVDGAFYIYEKDPNANQGEVNAGTMAANTPSPNNPKPSDNKPNEPPPTEKSTDSFDAKALAPKGHAIYSLVRYKNGIPEAYFAGDVAENRRLASQGWKSLGMIGKGCTIPQKDAVSIKRLPNNQGIPEYPQFFIGIPPNDKVRNSAGFGLVWLEPKPGLIECLLMRTKQGGLFSLATDKQEIAARMKTGQWTIEKRFYILPPD